MTFTVYDIIPVKSKETGKPLRHPSGCGVVTYFQTIGHFSNMDRVHRHTDHCHHAHEIEGR